MDNKCLLLIASLIILSTGCKDEIPFEPNLSVSPNILETFSSEGGESKVTINTNLEWVATPSATWINVSPTSGDSKTKSIRVLTLSNEEYDSREGHVILRNSEYGISDTVYVSQVQKDAILITANTYEISCEGGDISFEVNSNVDFKVYSNQSWVKQKESRGLTKTELFLTVEANTDIEARTATLSIRASNVEQKVTILQAGYDDTIERNALIALYNSTNGDNWKDNTNWCSDKPLNEWSGVHVNTNNRVYYINLNNNNLQGTIPAELGNLTNLKTLYLYYNQLSGNIPAELGNLANLETLYLVSNQLSGSIPSELGNLANLKTLNLGSNQLSGSIPTELCNLANLETLKLYDNQLSGNIPAELENLTKLETLSLGHNQLTGSIPTKLGNLTNLETLYLGANQLTGSIPAELGNLTNLKALDLYDSQVSGNIPAELGNLANLETLNLLENQLTGSIPAELGNLTNLETLNLYYNQLSGNIPAELGNLTNLNTLYLRSNKLSGSIPAELGNLTNLVTLDLSYNQLTGEIPAFIGNMKYYSSVDLCYNNLEGDPPAKVTEHTDWHIYWPRLVSGSKVNLTGTDINAPEFTVTDMNGNTIKSDELYENNTITILYKWAKWCGYSLQYNETLKKIYEQYHNKGLEILGSYDRNCETKNEVKEYINENIPWPNHFMDYGNEEKGIAPNWITQFGLINAVPEVIVVDSNKKVVFQGFTEDRFDLPLFLFEYF